MFIAMWQPPRPKKPKDTPFKLPNDFEQKVKGAYSDKLKTGK